MKTGVGQIGPRYPDKRVANFDVLEDQCLDLGVTQINRVESHCGITGENVVRIDRHLSPIRFFRISLDKLERPEAFHIGHALLTEREDRALAKDLEPTRALYSRGQVRIDHDMHVERTRMRRRIAIWIICNQLSPGALRLCG